MIKVFLSHQSADSVLAGRIAYRLRTVHGIDCYLDTIDPNIQRGEDLAAHIRSEMGMCTQLLAIVSQKTATSQWVPWEVGVATEKDYPLATFAGDSVMPPEFLRKWPYLRSDADLDRYAAVSKQAESALQRKSMIYNRVDARRDTTREFYRELRASLGQY